MSGVLLPVARNGQVDAVEHLTSFEVESVRPMGRGNKGHQKYYIKVKISGEDGHDKFIGFHTCSKTLEIAFEMIEVIGKQTKNLGAAEFKNYLNEHKGKRIWFSMTQVENDDFVSAYQTDQLGRSLERFILEPTKIEFTVLKQLREDAKLERTRIDVDPHAPPVRLRFKKKGNQLLQHQVN